jgi:hypothetical protein
MPTNEVTSSVPPEFEEAGIKPLAYGQPELPKATSYTALARQIEREGIQDEAGNVLARPAAEGALALARQFAHPRTTGAALKAPMYKHVQAGTIAMVHSPVLLTRVNPSLLNPRVGPMISIPKADGDGRVAVSWAPADVSEDPSGSERLVQRGNSLDELMESSRETANKILALQQDLSELIGREGIEEPLLIVMTRLEIEGLDQPVRETVPLTADGGSRVTIAQEHLAEAIATLLSEKEREYATKHKRRRALEELERALRAHQPATLIDDPVAERELREFLVELSRRPAAELIQSKLYAAQRSLVAPAMVVVGFRPNGSATILDAIDQMVANQHKRGPLQWQPAAQALDSRNSVVRGLWRQAKIGEAKAMLLGPRYEEAIKRYGMHAEPDFRIGETVRIFHGNDARRLIREAFGTPSAKTADRAEVIAAVIGEQLRHADPAHRRQVETTLRDILGHAPFYGNGVPELSPTNPDVDELVARVRREEQSAPKKLSVAHAELGVKGGVALVMLGALAREHGAPASEVARPYAVLQRMLHDPFGQELLGEAISALRSGNDALPARDPKSRDPKGRDAENRIVRMDASNLRELFTPDSSGDSKGGDGSRRTQDDILAELRSLARNDFGRLLTELQALPEVGRTGLAPHKVKVLTELLMDQASELEYLGRKGADHLRASERDATVDAGSAAAA